MQLQGVWMHNFIEQYAPGMQWGAAPFPSAMPGLERVALADSDVIVIPRGSRHPKEAWEFIQFVNSQEGMEILCMGQRKFSPLRQVTDAFWENHPHPYITLFRDLALSPNCHALPKTGVLREYQREMGNAFDRCRNHDPDHPARSQPAAVLRDVRIRLQRSLDRELRRLRKRGVLAQ